MILLEIHLAAPGRAGDPGRELSAALHARIRQALASRVTVVSEMHRAARASSEFLVELSAWDRTAVLQLARALFSKTTLRGSIAASYSGDVFFQLATPGGSAGLKWREDDVPQVTPSTTGEETR